MFQKSRHVKQIRGLEEIRENFLGAKNIQRRSPKAYGQDIGELINIIKLRKL